MPYGPQIRIRDFREARSLTISQLVERIKAEGYEAREGQVSHDTIRNVELGYKAASKPLMTAWAKALGLNPLDVWQPPAKPKSTRLSPKDSAA